MDKYFGVVPNIFAFALSAFGYLFGAWDIYLIALIIFVALDQITGVIKATIEQKVSSEVGFIGILKKVLIFVVVTIAVILDGLLNLHGSLRLVTLCFYIANEGISVLENIAGYVSIPEKLRNVLLQLRDKDNNKEDNVEK